MARIEYKNDRTRATEETEGSDGRLNVSARTDPRGYYNSRDNGQTYSLTFTMTNAISTEEVVYLKNTSTDKTIVVSAIGINSELDSQFKLKYVTGTAAGTSTTTPVPTNLNKDSSNDAQAETRVGATAATGITGLTDDGEIDLLWVTALGHEEFRLGDRLRLGQNDAVAIEMFKSPSDAETDVAGVIFFYLE